MPTDEQIQQAAEGFKTIANTNAPVESGDGYRLWLILVNERPVGALCICGVYNNVAEIGVNFWAAPSPNQIRILEQWAKEYLTCYDGLMCRVYGWNSKVLKVVARYGFTRLGDTGEDVQVWGVAIPNIRYLGRGGR